MDPYRELGLSPEAETEPELIRAAFKALAKKYHPDGTTDPIEKARAEEKMRRLNEAQRLILSGEYRPSRTSTMESERVEPARPESPPQVPKPPPPVPARRVPTAPAVAAALCLLLALLGPGLLQKKYLQRAQELEKLGQYEQALNEVSEAIRGDSRNGEAFLLRARLWQKLGHPERAKVDIANARSLVSPAALQSAAQALSPSPSVSPETTSTPPNRPKGGN